MKAKLPLTLIFIQLIIIPFIGVHVYKKYNSASVISVSPIERDSIIFVKDKNFTYFYEPKPNIIDLGHNFPDWLPYKPTYTINADSLNERFDYTPQKPKDTYRIITLGDSFTFGLHVNTYENFTEVLEDLLNRKLACGSYKKFEVINLGMTQYDIEYSVRRFELRGKKYNPDLIIWLLKQDDFDFISELTLGKINRYDAELLEKVKAGILKESQLDDFDTGREARTELIEEIGIEKIIDYQIKALYSISEHYKDDLLIYSPKGFFEAQDMDNGKIINEFVRSRPNTYLHINNVDLAYVDGLLPDMHPNRRGHSLMAKDILSYLIANKVIPCD